MIGIERKPQDPEEKSRHQKNYFYSKEYHPHYRELLYLAEYIY